MRDNVLPANEASPFGSIANPAEPIVGAGSETTLLGRTVIVCGACANVGGSDFQYKLTPTKTNPTKGNTRAQIRISRGDTVTSDPQLRS